MTSDASDNVPTFQDDQRLETYDRQSHVNGKQLEEGVGNVSMCDC